MITGMQLKELVTDIAKKGEKPIAWFTKKYGIDYNEYNYVSFAAIPAIAFRNLAAKYKIRISEMEREVGKIVDEGMEIAKGNRAIEELLVKILLAAGKCGEPFSDKYLNEEVEIDEV